MPKVLVCGSLLVATSLLLASSAATQFEASQTRAPSGPALPLVSPMRIAEGPPGQVLVSDSRQDKIVALDENTQAPIWSFDVQGTPMAVGFASGLVLIGNASTHNVEVYRLKGSPTGPKLKFQFNLGFTPPDTPGDIQTPSDLDIDEDAGLAFVLDSGEHRVKVFSLDGTAVSSFPPSDSPARLFSPTAITVDPVRQEVLVSDYGDPNGYFSATVAARIMVYTYGGEFVTMINGGVANRDFQFARPQGLGTDSQGRVFMAESVLGQVFVFDRATGGVVKKLGSFGDGPGELMLPLDLLIDRESGDVLVTNNMLGRIEIFRAAGGLP